MCGRYRLSRRKQLVEEYFDAASDAEEWSPRYNVAPTPACARDSPEFERASQGVVADAMGTHPLLGEGLAFRPAASTEGTGVSYTEKWLDRETK